MADNEEKDNLIDDTIDDEKEAREEAKQERQQQRENIKNTADTANNILQKFGVDVVKPVKDFFSKILKHILPSLGTVLAVILIIVVTIGLISFILNAPGLMREKFSEIIANIAADIDTKLYGENNKLSGEAISKEERLELLNYISSDMGFDVIGFGFVPMALYDTKDENGESVEGKQKISDYETKLGYVDGFDSENEFKSSNPDADLMYYYIMANERAYTINDDGSPLARMVAGIFSETAASVVPLFRIFNPTPSSLIFGHKNAWTGMINIDEGSLKDEFDIETSIDKERKMLSIAIKNPSIQNGLLNKDLYAFSMDGWTGRYGMPIEFSLALHISTMSSGLVKEMITNKDLQTHVTIKMLRLTCAINFKITLENGREIEIPYNPPNGETPDELLKKIKKYDSTHNKEDMITDEDLSIRSLVLAARTLLNTYSLPEDEIIDGNYIGISRHIGALGALLGTNDFAVREKNERQDEYLIPDNVLSVYQMDELTDSGTDNGREFLGRYSIASGAYVCSYDSSGNPDVSTGKIAATFYTDDQSKSYTNNYTLYYKQDNLGNDEDVGTRYRVYCREIGSEEEICMGGDQFAPNQGGAKISFNDGLGDMYFRRISGLGSIRNSDSMEVNVKLNRMATDEKEAYTAMIREIDWFMTVISYSQMLTENPPADGLGYSPAYFADTAFREAYVCYTVQFERICDLVDEGNFEEAKNELNNMLDRIEKDYNYLTYISNNTQSTHDKIINRALKDAGYEGLDISVLEEVLEIFTGTKDINNGEVEYAQPYITEVTRHWFKDVIFDGVDGFTSVYDPTTDTFSIPYTGEDFDNKIQVSAILDPIDPEKENFYYVQNGEPYVIKGNTVQKDGKKERVIDDNNKIEAKSEKDGYCYGDGYRATKKLFTQGFYYTFDGSQETAKSIFWQQQLEDMDEGSVVEVVVINGKIFHVIAQGVISDKETTETLTTLQVDENGKNKNPANEGVVFIENIAPREKDGTIVRGGGARYQLTINNLKYLSPAENSYEDVKTRVNHINDVWKAMGVTCYRQHVSFDNVSAAGEALANTGLSILKNCNTKDAEYIYRELKEMLIDLGYYTEAEFDQLDVKLKWFIPRYNPKQWPQNDVGNFTFGAVLNPREDDDDGSSYTLDPSETEDANGRLNGGAGTNYTSSKALEKKSGSSENNNSTSGSDENSGNSESSGNTETTAEDSSVSQYTKYSKEKGFRKDLKIIAPGACLVKEVDGDTIEIEFDGVAQPSISAMHGYKMTITGIVPVAQEGDRLSEGDELARTGTTQIKVFLRNDIGRLLSNVSDYMSPKRAGNQPYEFTDDEIVLLATVIQGEASPGAMIDQMQYEIDEKHVTTYETAEEAAMAYAEAVGYVLINRALLNMGGSTIEEQVMSSAYGGGGYYNMEKALAMDAAGAITEKSMEAALVCATFDCDIIVKPDDPNIKMSRDVTGESAWRFGHEVFWWLDERRDGVPEEYAETIGSATVEHPYPVEKGKGSEPGEGVLLNWPWDGYLTYSY